MISPSRGECKAINVSGATVWFTIIQMITSHYSSLNKSVNPKWIALHLGMELILGWELGYALTRSNPTSWYAYAVMQWYFNRRNSQQPSVAAVLGRHIFYTWASRRHGAPDRYAHCSTRQQCQLNRFNCHR